VVWRAGIESTSNVARFYWVIDGMRIIAKSLRTKSVPSRVVKMEMRGFMFVASVVEIVGGLEVQIKYIVR
jgi:hypothetical protein